MLFVMEFSGEESGDGQYLFSQIENPEKIIVFYVNIIYFDFDFLNKSVDRD